MSGVLVDSATWILRVYGVLAIAHLLIQYRYALGHQWHLSREMARVAERRESAVRRHAARFQRAATTARSTRTQVRSSPKTRRRQRFRHVISTPRSLAVWVTVYQEGSLDLLRECFRSLQAQDFDGRLGFFVSDDGSYLRQIDRYRTLREIGIHHVFVKRIAGPLGWFLPNRVENVAERLAYYQAKRAELLAVYDEFRSDDRFTFILSAQNEGKREAQHKAWLLSLGYALYGSVDSDTVLDPDAFSLLASNFRNPDVAAATGYVDVRNAKVNLLTRLIDQRYWHAFHVERAGCDVLFRTASGISGIRR
jgi:cellulose synthase/poly-beta-1,6-N-acetylglucosamine synthase-like glycosyltransferase